jgi:hypothetical protein
MTHGEYIKLIDELLAGGKTTRPKQSEAMFNYGRLNRECGLEETVVFDGGVISATKNLNSRMVWLILTEGWCDDVAQNIPVIEKIAAQSGNIETRYILRDENPDLMGSLPDERNSFDPEADRIRCVDTLKCSLHGAHVRIRHGNCI